MERNNFIEWSPEKLEATFVRLQKHETEPYLTEERREQLRKVMTYIAFEGLMQQRENNQRTAEVEQLETIYAQ